MGQQNKTTLKTYFETGDTPTQAQFVDLIDSQINPSDNTTDDLPEGTNKYVSAAQKTKLDGIEANADVTDADNVGAVNAAATSKTTPVDADSYPIVDSEASNAIKRLTFTNLKAFLKTYFDTVYAATSQTDFISGLIDTAEDKDYRLIVNIPYGGTITSTTTRSASGTCTATFKVNTTALGGTANSVSSTEQEQSHSTSNTFDAGDDIVITVSSNSSCEDLSFTIKFTRTLS